MFVRTTLFGLLVVGMASLATAQIPYADPYSARGDARAVHQVQLASQRARASVPVSYSFPVRRDYSLVSGLNTYPSLSGQTGNFYPSDGRLVYRPTTYNGQSCGQVNNGTAAYTNYYPRTNATFPQTNATFPQTNATFQQANAVYPQTSTINAAHPYYVGTSFGGSSKVYPRNQPIRNFFRYLIP